MFNPILFFLLVMSTATNAEPLPELKSRILLQKFTPFKADYVGRYTGVPVKAKGIRELRLDAKGNYVFRSFASSMMIKAEEITTFQLQDGTVQPLTYEYRRSNVGKKQNTVLNFDWDNLETTYSGTRTPLKFGTLDKLSYQMQLRQAVAARRATGETGNIILTVADKEKRREYQFQIDGEETLNTPAGKFKTVKVKRVRDDPNRFTEFWLAMEHEYLLIKLAQQDEGSGFELNLKSIAWY